MFWVKKNLRWIIPLFIAIVLGCFLVTYYYTKPRLVFEYYEYYSPELTKSEKVDAYFVKDAYGDVEEYTIPQSYRGKPVVGIATRAFYKHSNLKRIIMEKPENLLYVDRFAFGFCSNLETFDLSNVVEIERNAFYECSKLNNLTVVAKNIGGSAFYGCTSLNTIKLEEGVKTIGTYAFSHTTFEALKLPKSIKSVYVDSFKHQTSIKSLAYYYTLESDYLKTLSFAVPYK